MKPVHAARASELPTLMRRTPRSASSSTVVKPEPTSTLTGFGYTASTIAAIMSRALASVSSRLRALTLHIPPQVLLVKTTGNEEAQTAYTRSYAIIVPQRYLSGSADDLETLLTHELFHVISRNAPARTFSMFGSST